MSASKSNRKQKPLQLAETLTDAEVQRLADRLAAVLVADHFTASDNISLMTLLSTPSKEVCFLPQ